MPEAPLSASDLSRIEVRRPAFPFEAPPGGPIPKHWMAGNALATHTFNALNLTFPDGERFFIRAVNDHLHAVQDPVLRQQVRAFAGQEAMHGNEHERYFDTLRAQGYEIDGFLRRFRRFIAWSDRLPASWRLAMTAGAEHYTATFGRFALEDPLVSEAHPVMRRLILWHAAEELEHKAVAFDVLRAAGISHFTRILGFVLATVSLFAWTIAGTRMLLRQDGVTRKEARALGESLRRRADPVARRRLLRRIASYRRRGFHPGKLDETLFAREKLREIGLASAH